MAKQVVNLVNLGSYKAEGITRQLNLTNMDDYSNEEEDDVLTDRSIRTWESQKDILTWWNDKKHVNWAQRLLCATIELDFGINWRNVFTQKSS